MTFNLFSQLVGHIFWLKRAQLILSSSLSHCRSYQILRPFVDARGRASILKMLHLTIFHTGTVILSALDIGYVTHTLPPLQFLGKVHFIITLCRRNAEIEPVIISK